MTNTSTPATPAALIATYHKADDLYEIADPTSRKWWTSTSSGDDARIMNDKLRIVSPTGPLGKRIRTAVKALQETNKQ